MLLFLASYPQVDSIDVNLQIPFSLGLVGTVLTGELPFLLTLVLLMVLKRLYVEVPPAASVTVIRG
jgi:hypothetical protein